MHMAYTHTTWLLHCAKATVVAAWMSLIFVSSQIAFPPAYNHAPATWFDYVFDKDVHVILYGVLAIALLWWLSGYGWKKKTMYATVFVIAVGYGMLDEWHQAFVPGRGVSMWDVVFDALGAWGGSMLWYIWVEWGVWHGIWARLIHRHGSVPQPSFE